MTGFLLDTNIPSEVMRPLPSSSVLYWFAERSLESMYLSVITLGEIGRGIELMPTGSRRLRHETWIQDRLLPDFTNRILPVTHNIADQWGRLDAVAQRRGAPVGTADGLIAATALVHDLVLVTRNVRDFARTGVSILNPWEL